MLPDHISGGVILLEDGHIGIPVGHGSPVHIKPAFPDHAALGVFDLLLHREARRIVNGIVFLVIGRGRHHDAVAAGLPKAVRVSLARQGHQAARPVIIPHGAHRARGVVLVHEERVTVRGHHQVVVQIIISLGRHFAVDVVFGPHQVISLGVQDRLTVQIIGGHDLPSVGIPFLMQLVGAVGVHIGLAIDIVIAGNDMLSVGVVFIGHPGIAVLAGCVDPLRVRVNLFQHAALAVQVVYDLLVALSAVDRLAIHVKILLHFQVGALEVGVHHLEIAQFFDDHPLVVFIIIGDFRGLLFAVIEIIHLGPAVRGPHALAVRAQIAFAGQPAHFAIGAFNGRVSLIRQVGGPLHAEILDQRGRGLPRLIGILHIRITLGTGVQLQISVKIAFLYGLAVLDFIFHPGIPGFIIKIGGVRFIIVGLGQQIVIILIRIPHDGIAVRPGDDLAVGVQPFLFHRAMDAVVQHELGLHYGEQLVRAQQLVIRAIIGGFQQIFQLIVVGLAGIAFGADHQVAVRVIIAALDHIAPAAVGDPALRPPAGGIDLVALQVVIGIPHLAVIAVVIPDRGIAQVLRHRRRAELIHIGERGDFFILVIFLLRIQVGGYLALTHGERQQDQQAEHQ